MPHRVIAPRRFITVYVLRDVLLNPLPRSQRVDSERARPASRISAYELQKKHVTNSIRAGGSGIDTECADAGTENTDGGPYTFD